MYSFSRTMYRCFVGSALTTRNVSSKIRPTMKRLRLCSKPALHSIRSKRICCSSVRRKEYLRLLLSDARFFLIVLSFYRVLLYRMPRPRRASTFVGQTPVCRTKVQLAVPAAGTKRRTTDRSFPASKIIRGSLRRHPVFKVQYYDVAARAANPSAGLRRSGAANRFGGHDGVLSCGRKHERTDAGSSAAVLPPVRADKTDSPRTSSNKFENE